MTQQRTEIRFVYLIQHGEIFKIGHSLNPHARLWQVVPATATDAKVVHCFRSANAGQIELALHRRFGHCRIKGEWFRLDQADVDLICRLTRTDAVDDLPADLVPPPPEPKEPNGDGNNEKRRKGVSTHAYIDPEVSEALNEYLAATEPQVSKTAAIESALREFLKNRGHWPRKGPSDAD